MHYGNQNQISISSSGCFEDWACMAGQTGLKTHCHLPSISHTCLKIASFL